MNDALIILIIFFFKLDDPKVPSYYWQVKSFIENLRQIKLTI